MGPSTPPGATFPLPQSTPIKVDSSTTLPFTTTQKYRVESCTAMADEIKKYIVGPMPAIQFLDVFFPTDCIPRYRKRSAYKYEAGCYDTTVKAASEREAYDPFVSPSK
jgi:hypothetical protein